MALLILDQLSLSYGDQVLFDRLNLNIEPGQRIALVGRNGAGKSSLIKAIDGRLMPDMGDIRHNTLKIRTLEQELPDDNDKTLFEVVAEGLGELGEQLKAYHQLLEHSESKQALSQLEKLQTIIEEQDGWRFDQKIYKTLEKLQLDPNALLSSLSGGWKRRVMLGRAWVSDPDLLLLDEPTNHLDIPAIEWLEQQLLAFKGTLMFISHDRRFLDNIATDIIELDRGRSYSHPGQYAAFLDRRDKRFEDEDKTNRLADKRLAEEEEWIRQGIKARRTRNEGRVKTLQAMRQTRSQRVERQGSATFQMESGSASGSKVFDIESLEFHHPDTGIPIIKDFSALVLRGDRIGLLGANGCGKSTLVKLLLNDLKPCQGKVVWGTKLSIGYFDQMRSALDLDKNVIDNVSQGRDFINVNGKSKHIYSYLTDFLFTPDRVRTPVGALSGGESNRVMLAKLFSQPSNLLILDEPTNDLDIDTLELLESLLSDYSGTVLTASHDRAFLDSVVSELWVFEGGGKISKHVGGYSDWHRRGFFLQKPVHNQAYQCNEESIPSSAQREARSKKQGSVTTKGTRRKLSYTLQRELDGLPEQIQAQEKAVATLQAESSATNFYQRPNVEVVKHLERLQHEQECLEALELRWLELEEIKASFSDSEPS